MFRLSAFALGLSAVALATAAQAADYQGYPEIRGAYEPQCCDAPYDDPLSYEISLRYVYSRGDNTLNAFGGTYQNQDTSHFLELYGRINDASTDTYLQANAGYAAVISGTYNTPATAGDTPMQIGKLGYAGADFGYLPWGSDTYGLGGFIGYKYRNESADMGRASYTTSGGGGDSENNNLELHELRLGVAGEADMGTVDIRAEAAAIPYARLSGTLGALTIANFMDGGTLYEQGSAGTVNGNLYGAAAQATVGVKATGNLKLTLGGRLSYLTGSTETHFTAREVGNPSNEQGYISRDDNAVFIRYGLLAGIGAEFN